MKYKKSYLFLLIFIIFLLKDTLVESGEELRNYLDKEIEELRYSVEAVKDILSQRRKETQRLREEISSLISKTYRKDISPQEWEILKKEICEQEAVEQNNIEREFPTSLNKNNEVISLKERLLAKDKYIENLSSKIASLQREVVSLKEILNSERANLYQKLATAYVQAKLYQQAIEAYQRSLEFNPHNPRIYYYIGLLYQYSEGNSEKAINSLNKYLELAPNGEFSLKAKKIIKMLQENPKQ